MQRIVSVRIHFLTEDRHLIRTKTVSCAVGDEVEREFYIPLTATRIKICFVGSEGPRSDCDYCVEDIVSFLIETEESSPESF